MVGFRARFGVSRYPVKRVLGGMVYRADKGEDFGACHYPAKGVLGVI